MRENDFITSSYAPPVKIPEGSSASKDPIEGGVAISNAAVPPGEDGHVTYRTLSRAELEQRGRDAIESVAFSRRAAAAVLRVQLSGMLERTAYLIADDAPDFKAWREWRKLVWAAIEASKVDGFNPDAFVAPAPPVPLDSL